MEELLKIAKEAVDGEKIFGLAFLLMNLSAIIGIKQGVWPFITNQWWPYYRQKQTDEQKQLELLNQISLQQMQNTQEIIKLAQTVGLLADKVTSFEPLSITAHRAIESLLKAGIRVAKSKRDFNLDDALDTVIGSDP